MSKKYIIVTCICTIISLVFGIISNDIVIGGIILLTGLLCSYFASEGKNAYIITKNQIIIPVKEYLILASVNLY